MTDEETKKIAESLNAQIRDNKCLRHQVQPTTARCRLCDAKREANGRFEFARQIYIRVNK